MIWGSLNWRTIKDRLGNILLGKINEYRSLGTNLYGGYGYGEKWIIQFIYLLKTP